MLLGDSSVLVLRIICLTLCLFLTLFFVPRRSHMW